VSPLEIPLSHNFLGKIMLNHQSEHPSAIPLLGSVFFLRPGARNQRISDAGGALPPQIRRRKASFGFTLATPGTGFSMGFSGQKWGRFL
jgi:hypothetical protein